MGLALTNSTLGVIAALTGGLMGSLLQSPIILALVASVLILFATSLFGFWELRLPGGVSQVADKCYTGTVCLVFATFWTTSWAMQGPGISWHTYSEQTLQEAKAEGKPVIIDFYADWYVWTGAMIGQWEELLSWNVFLSLALFVFFVFHSQTFKNGAGVKGYLNPQAPLLLNTILLTCNNA